MWHFFFSCSENNKLNENTDYNEIKIALANEPLIAQHSKALIEFVSFDILRYEKEAGILVNFIAIGQKLLTNNNQPSSSIESASLQYAKLIAQENQIRNAIYQKYPELKGNGDFQKYLSEGLMPVHQSKLKAYSQDKTN